MRTLLALFALALIAACPRGSSTTTSGSASAEPTPPPRVNTSEEEREEAPVESTPGPSATSSQIVIHAVIVPVNGPSAKMPDGLMVVSKADGALHVKGNPRALPTRGGDWRTAAALGEESAVKLVVNLPVLLTVLAGGADTLHGGVRITGDAPDDAVAQLQGLGLTVLSTTEAGIEVQVPASRLDRLLAVSWVGQFEVSP